LTIPFAIRSVFRAGGLRERGLQPEHWSSIAFWILAAYLLLVFATFADYGVSYDQEWHSVYGRHVLSWYSSLFQDQNALEYRNMFHYGALFDASAETVVKLSPFGRYETRNLLSALWAGLAGLGTYKLAAYVGGRRIGVLALTLILLTPRFYGHGFINPKDIPFATATVFTLYFIVQAVHVFPQIPRHLLLKLGIAVGCALGVRVGGLILLAYLAFAMGLWLVARYAPSVGTEPIRRSPGAIGRLAAGFAAVGFIAYLFMLVWWPAAQARPLTAPREAIEFTTAFPHPFQVFFDGGSISTAELPWYYLPKWFWITSPEFYLVGFLAAVVLVGVFSRSREKRERAGLAGRETWVGIATITFAALFPVVFTVIKSPVDYDGVRHFLFVLPPSAVLCALAIAKSIELARRGALKVALSALLALTMIVTAADLVALHPFQYVYFNRVAAGGVGAAAGSYETDYWGTSLKNGVEWLVDNYEGDTDGRRPRVATCLHSLSTTYYLPADRFEFVGTVHTGQHVENDSRPDLFLSHPRWDCDTTFSGTLLHTVEVGEASLLSVVEVSEGDEVP
jgi:hypothetical protein